MRLLATACFAALIAMSAPAQADSGGADADFLAGLKSADISYKDGPDAVRIGRRACELVEQGHPPADVIKAMTDQNPGSTSDGAAKFLDIAENKLCPQTTSSPAPQPAPGPAPGEPKASSATTYDPGTAGASGGGAPAGGGG